MKPIYALPFYICLAAALTFYIWSQNTPPSKQPQSLQALAHNELPIIAKQEYNRRELPNGGIIFEAIDSKLAQTPQDLDDITPAAGGSASNIKYEPLTKTFRRTVIDSEGNSRQEIIKHPANR